MARATAQPVIFTDVRKSEKLQTAKVTFKVTQGHWYWCHSIGHIQFPISVRLQLPLLLCETFLTPIPQVM